MNANQVYPHLKFCPECGGELEKNPISTWMSCFLHGDLIIEANRVVWDFTKNLITRD